MWVKEPDSNKRNNERIDRSFAISMLPGQDGETNEDDIYVFISSGFSNSKVVYNGYRAIWDDMYVVLFSK